MGKDLVSRLSDGFVANPVQNNYNNNMERLLRLNRKISPKLKENKLAEKPYLVDMQEYMRFFKNDERAQWKNHFEGRDSRRTFIVQACPETTRPDPDEISTYKNVYQHINITIKHDQKGSEEMPVWFLNFYYDNRFVELGSRLVRTVMTIKGPGCLFLESEKDRVLNFLWKTEETTQYGLFWYEGYKNPVSSPCYAQDAAYLLMNVSGSFYYQMVMSCKYPEIGMTPVNISLVSKPCEKPLTYKPILYPEPRRHPAARDIGVCVQPMFGTMDDNDVAYIVSWLEMIRIFGASEVTVTNVSLTVSGDLIKRAFKYYEDSGFLTITHYPIVNPIVRTAWDEHAGSYSIKQLAVSDCFYRKIQKYWYVLIHDMDEIVVPKKHPTYVEYIGNYTLNNTTASELDCLSVRSQYFYRILPSKENSYPDYVPLLKMTQRYPVEPFGIPGQGGIGMSKSFDKMRRLVTSGSHMCRGSHHPRKQSTQGYFPPEDIIIHHYRKHCDPSHGNNEGCMATLNETTEDLYLARYAPTLVPRVENVLRKIGYFDVKNLND